MPIIHALLEVVGVVLVWFTLPLVLELCVLSIAALFPPRTSLNSSAKPPRLFVVIPAHNEEKLIATCVRSVLASTHSNTGIFVIAHNCTDATAAAAEAAGAQVLSLNDTIGGKGTALDFGFTHALAWNADAVLVIDADSMVSPNLIASVSAAFSAGAQAVQCRYEVANPEATPRTRLMTLSFLGINVLRPRGRARLGLSCGIFGNGFALSAETLRRVPYTASSIVEDLEYHLRLLRAGVRVDFLDHATVFGEMPESGAASATQRARWEGGRLHMRRRFTGPLLRDILCGRLRLLEPLLDLRSLPLATQTVLLSLALLLPLAWVRLYVFVGLLSVALHVLVAAWLGTNPAATLRALAVVPGYMLWKLAMLPRTRLASRKDAAWVRTRRNDAP